MVRVGRRLDEWATSPWSPSPKGHCFDVSPIPSPEADRPADCVAATAWTDAARLLDVSEVDVAPRCQRSAEPPFSSLGGHLMVRVAQSGKYVFEHESLHHQYWGQDCRLQAGRRSTTAQEMVFLDCGTTMLHQAALSPVDIGLTLLCHSINVVDIAMRHGLHVVMLGCAYQDRLTAVNCSHHEEVALKQAAMSRAAFRAVVVNGAKSDRVRPAHLAAPEVFQSVFCDKPGPVW